MKHACPKANCGGELARKDSQSVLLGGGVQRVEVGTCDKCTAEFELHYRTVVDVVESVGGKHAVLETRDIL